jgi:hypothetical protein
MTPSTSTHSVRTDIRYVPASEATYVDERSHWVEIDRSARGEDPLAGFEEYDFSGWDGERAEPIQAATIRNARRFFDFLLTLPREGTAPNVSPGADGTIGFEWRPPSGGLKKLFVEIRPDDTVRAYWVYRDGQMEKRPPRLVQYAIYSLEHIIKEARQSGT